MDKVISPDGTLIAYNRSGTGPALILVPGSGAANPVAWTAVLPKLEKNFTVYAVDRRAHGESGDSPVVVMPGQQHIAMYTAPDLFLKNVLMFLIGTH